MNQHLGNNNIQSVTNLDQQPTFIPLSQDRLWYPLGNSTRTKATFKCQPFYTNINPDMIAVNNIQAYLQNHLMPLYQEVSIVINELQFMFGPPKQFWPQFILLRSLVGEERETLITQFKNDVLEDVKRLFPDVESNSWTQVWVPIEDTNPPAQHDIVVPIIVKNEARLFFLVCPKYGLAFVK